MSINLLELNEQVPDNTPKRFIVYGSSMSGKSYMAQKFPSPLMLSTDGNGIKNTVPTIDIKGWDSVPEDIQAKYAKAKRNVSSLKEVLGSLESIPFEKNPYKTLVIDLIDDIPPMLQKWALYRYNMEQLLPLLKSADGNKNSEKEIAKKFFDPENKSGAAQEFHPGRSFGRMSVLYNNEFSGMLSKFKSLDMYIVFISYVIEYTDQKTKQECTKPALSNKDLNKIQGICDMTIHLNRNSNNIRTAIVETRRSSDGYSRNEIDQSVAKVIDEIKIQNFWKLPAIK